MNNERININYAFINRGFKIKLRNTRTEDKSNLSIYICSNEYVHELLLYVGCSVWQWNITVLLMVLRLVYLKNTIIKKI